MDTPSMLSIKYINQVCDDTAKRLGVQGSLEGLSRQAVSAASQNLASSSLEKCDSPPGESRNRMHRITDMRCIPPCLNLEIHPPLILPNW